MADDNVGSLSSEEKEKHLARSKKSKSEKKSRKREAKDSAEPVAKKQKSSRPLNGMVVSVSTLKGEVGDETGKESSYSAVSDSCKALGAEVISQVCKRVQMVICTRSAVKQATQRVRKAYKKRIPIVEVGWLDKCRTEKVRPDIEPFRLEKEVKEAVNNRQKNVDNEKSEPEVLPDAGWSEPAKLGCCCVCHENGAETDCKWCANQECAK